MRASNSEKGQRPALFLCWQKEPVSVAKSSQTNRRQRAVSQLRLWTPVVFGFLFSVLFECFLGDDATSSLLASCSSCILPFHCIHYEHRGRTLFAILNVNLLLLHLRFSLPSRSFRFQQVRLLDRAIQPFHHCFIEDATPLKNDNRRVRRRQEKSLSCLVVVDWESSTLSLSQCSRSPLWRRICARDFFSRCGTRG